MALNRSTLGGSRSTPTWGYSGHTSRALTWDPMTLGHPLELHLVPKQSLQEPRPPNVPLLRAIGSLLDGIWGVLKGSWGVLEDETVCILACMLACCHCVDLNG